MATGKINQASDIEEYLRDLLECPVCMETIKSVPVYQCINGHVICEVCIEKLKKCPICRNNSALVRSLKLENIVQKLEGIQPEKKGSMTTTTHLQKWGKGFVRSYGTINGPNQEPPVEIPIPQVAVNQDQEAARLLREESLREWDRNYYRRNRCNILFTLFGFLFFLLYILFLSPICVWSGLVWCK